EFKFLAGIVSTSKPTEDVSSRRCRLNGRLVFRDMANGGLRMQTLNNSMKGVENHSRVKSVVLNFTQTVEIPPQKYDELVV
ncbi:hypothetical protein AZE42_00401, partial [Rhizopogon vesiculosus]